MGSLECILEDKINFENKDGRESYIQTIRIQYCATTILDLNKFFNKQVHAIYATLYLQHSEMLHNHLVQLINDVCKSYQNVLSTLSMTVVFKDKTVKLHPDNFSNHKLFNVIQYDAYGFSWHSNTFYMSYIPEENSVEIRTNCNVSKQLARLLGRNYDLSKKDVKTLRRNLTDVLSYLD